MSLRLFALFSLICLLLCTQVTAAPNNNITTTTNTTSTACPEGTHDCGFFKCVKEPNCPLDCKFYDNQTSCDKTRMNGVGCIWRGNSCYRDIQCKALAGNKCTEGCMDCGHFKCFPNGGKCPAGCDSYTNQQNCLSATVFNGVGCQWSNTTCSYREMEIRSAKPNAGASHVGFMPNGEDSTSVNPMVVNTPTGDSQAMMDVKANSLAGPIAGVVVGLVAAGCMAFVLIHKRVESKKQLKQQMAIHQDAEISSNDVPKTLYRPQSLLHVVRNVLGLKPGESNNHNIPR
ncbi:hypothetical protein K7432_008707 [Basidiobolus ranarum]|uniref:Uncharacterized protein n=1 Tax=Basidiobolus ranarum TaxID=34480 RepID=A0ABR2VY57_9FUNG